MAAAGVREAAQTVRSPEAPAVGAAVRAGGAETVGAETVEPGDFLGGDWCNATRCVSIFFSSITIGRE